MGVDVDQQMAILRRGAAEIISEADLIARLKENRPLRIKLGIDPTAPSIHLGFAVVLRKLRQFQDLGHQVILLIGDFTARVGDPTGRSETRKVLTPEEIEANAQTYKEQFALILDPARTEIRFNSEWLGPMSFADVIQLGSRYTVARIMERDDFQNRYRDGIPIGLHELIYPLMQGFDSVALRSDVEMGGTDQKFNNLVGRQLQREYEQPPQIVMLMPILVGLDGVQKMSKSLGNTVGITDEPNDMFGKLMSLPDANMRSYFELCTEVDMDEVDRRLASDHPRSNKMWLGREIVTIYHGADAAQAAQAEFEKVFSRRENPTDIEEKKVEAPEGKVQIGKLVAIAGLAPSNKEARRLVTQGGVSLDGAKVTEPTEVVDISGNPILKVGRKFLRVSPL